MKPSKSETWNGWITFPSDKYGGWYDFYLYVDGKRKAIMRWQGNIKLPS
jgi:hypothetical protein